MSLGYADKSRLLLHPYLAFIHILLYVQRCSITLTPVFITGSELGGKYKARKQNTSTETRNRHGLAYTWRIFHFSDLKAI